MNNNNKSITDAQEALKQEILAGLPPAENLLQKTMNYALDKIRAGEDVEHYKEVLARLAKIMKR